ncbi:MAG: excinuclease ABC subunit UvrC [Clostridia bacterium]
MIKEQLNNLPESSGIYIYRDSFDNILYVGKAKCLKNRIKQYFMSGVTNSKVLALVERIAKLEFIVTPSESDALSLENTLIKKYKPPYNILLKDDKQYCYIKINVKQDFPRLIFTRKIIKDNFTYYGPFTSGGRMLVDCIITAFPLATCKFNFDKLSKNFRPCLNYHIATCPAPCVNNITREEYSKTIKQIQDLLGGKTELASQILTCKMNNASNLMQYEQAQIYKQYLSLLHCFRGGSVVVQNKLVDYDIFSITTNGQNTACNRLLVRGGKVYDSCNYLVVDAGIELEQTLTSFIMSYYNLAQPSKTIITNIPLADQTVLEELLSKKQNKKISVVCPIKKGAKKSLVDMSKANAEEFLQKNQSKEEKKYLASQGAVEQLKLLLNLTKYPTRIECYDISNISGVDKVASQVVFTRGMADTKQYRRFKIRTVEGADDFASMYEVVSRRLAHLNANDVEFGSAPDLIVVDGGLGQLSSANKALQDANQSIELISLAEREEIVYTLTNKQGIKLPRSSYAFKLLVNIRDEAHRYAITYFRQLHNKNGLRSSLENIAGVGKIRQIELIKKFGSVDNISKASLEELSSTPRITKPLAQKIFDYFNR